MLIRYPGIRGEYSYIRILPKWFLLKYNNVSGGCSVHQTGQVMWPKFGKKFQFSFISPVTDYFRRSVYLNSVITCIFHFYKTIWSKEQSVSIFHIQRCLPWKLTGVQRFTAFKHCFLLAMLFILSGRRVNNVL
jgi:hypothetical protein